MSEAVPQNDQENKFNLYAKLNDKAFVEHLSKYPDELEPNEANEDLFEARYEALKYKNEASKELKKIYKEVITQETGIKLEESDLKCIDTFLEKAAIEDPEAIKDFLDSSKNYRATLVEISRLEKRFEDFKSKSDLEKKRDVLEVAKGSAKEGVWDVRKWKASPLLGWYFRSDDDKAAISKAKDVYGISLGQVVSEYQETVAQLKTLEELEQLKKESSDRFRVLQSALFDEFPPAKKLLKIVQDKAKNLFTEYEKTGEIPALVEIEKRYATFEKTRETGSLSAFDYMEGFDASQFEKDLSKRFETSLCTDMEKAVKDFSLTGTPLSTMESVLKKFIDKSEIGSKKDEESKDFLKESLERIIEDKGLSKEKRLLLRAVMARNFKS